VRSRAQQQPPRKLSARWALRAFRADALAMFGVISEEPDGMARIQALGKTFVFLSHPDHVRRVLQTNHRNYSKDAPIYTVARPFLSDGLLVAPGGNDWLQRRRLVQPVFSRDNVRTAIEVTERCLADTVERWQSHAAGDSVVDLSSEMVRLTMRVACRSFFGIDVDSETEQLAEDLGTVSDLTAEFLVRPFPPLFVPTRRNRAFRRSMHRIQRFIDPVVTSRSTQASGRAGITAAFVDAADGLLTPDRIRDELIGLFFAGHQSLAHTLAWCWHLLSDHHAVRDRLHEEIARVLGGRTPTFHDLPQLTYARMIFQEAMRLYPVAWIMMRRALAPDEMAGRRIPAGAIVTWSPFVANRHPDVWPRPDEFRPERFAEPGPASFAPFGLGPRACVAGDFATAEACLILVTLAQRFETVPVGSAPPVPEPSMTLHPRGGLPARLITRPTPLPTRRRLSRRCGHPPAPGPGA
jgi:cytochrome P450